MRWWMVLIGCAAGCVAAAQTSEGPCDEELLKLVNSKDPDRYMDRKGRCEGLYSQDVAGSFGNLLVASLTVGKAVSGPWPPRLTVQCSYKEPVQVHIQAFPLQPRTFYRLDAMARGSEVNYEWNTDVIAKYIQPGNVGLVAWASATVNARPQRVYLPVRTATTVKGPLQLVVVSPSDLSDVFLSITAPGDKAVLTNQSLGKGSFLARERIVIPFPALPLEGIYRVNVTGKTKVGIASTGEFLVYSRGK